MSETRIWLVRHGKGRSFWDTYEEARQQQHSAERVGEETELIELAPAARIASLERELEEAQAQLAERTRERDELKEWSDAAVASCAKHQCSMRDARLRESEARAEAAERQVEKLREALRGRVVTDYFCEQCDRGWMEENVEQHAPGCLAAHQEPKP